ncbi:hypothetical protein MD484_g2311, partial [Candolleomyces efflorescens]
MASTPSTTDIDFANMPSPTADLEETWTYLSKGVEHIMTNFEHRLSPKGYMSLYSTVYNYCTSTRMLGGDRRGADLGYELYNKLSLYFISHFKGMLKEANSLEDIELLQYYADKWSRYTRGANYLNRLFTFLNRHWVERVRKEGKKSVYPVYTLALAQWKIHFFMHIQKDNAKLSSAVLNMITQERNGEVVDQDLIKDVVDSFVSLGLDHADLDKECLDIYKEQFEAAFLSATESYYKTESEAFLSVHSVSEYLKKAEDRLREEENRVERYLHHETRKDLVSKCEYVLIRELMRDRFPSLHDSDKNEDLQGMYALLSQIPEGLGPLQKRFEDHVKGAGPAPTEKVVGADGVNVNSDS